MLLSMTKLDAINTILSSIGSDPVNTLDSETDVDVANALRILEKTSRDIQRKGWDFNTAEYTFSPDVLTKKILWDDSIISFKSTDSNTYAKRGLYLYDVTNKTFEFTANIVLKTIVALDFEDLPDCFKNYIAAKTAIAFQTRYMGDSSVSQSLEYDMAEAYQDIVDYDLNMGSYNMLQLSNVADALTRT